MEIADADGAGSAPQRGARGAQLGRHAVGRDAELDERLDVARLERGSHRSIHLHPRHVRDEQQLDSAERGGDRRGRVVRVHVEGRALRT